jgi:hypothetical protein
VKKPAPLIDLAGYSSNGPPQWSPRDRLGVGRGVRAPDGVHLVSLARSGGSGNNSPVTGSMDPRFPDAPPLPGTTLLGLSEASANVRRPVTSDGKSVLSIGSGNARKTDCRPLIDLLPARPATRDGGMLDLGFPAPPRDRLRRIPNATGSSVRLVPGDDSASCVISRPATSSGLVGTFERTPPERGRLVEPLPAQTRGRSRRR